MASNFPTKRRGYGSFALENLPMVINEDSLAYWRAPAVMPAIMALLNKIKLVRAEGGLISTTGTVDLLRETIANREFEFDSGKPVTGPEMKAIFDVISTNARGSIYGFKGSQLLPANSRWAGNVPLFLSAFKEFRNTKYSEWDLSDPKLELVTDKNNLAVFSFIGEDMGWDNEQLLEFGKLMRTSGKGDLGSKALFKTNRTGLDPDFDSLPTLVKLMLTQQWAYQYGVPSKYAIISLTDIDAECVPPLIETEANLFDKPTEQKGTEPIGEFTW